MCPPFSYLGKDRKMAKSKATSIKFEDMTKAELIAMCKDFGLDISARAKKEQIISILKSKSGSPKQDAPKPEAAPTLPEAKDDSLWGFMHSMDYIQPKVIREKKGIHRIDPGAAEEEKNKISESDIRLARSRDDVYSPIKGIIDGCDSDVQYETDEKGREYPYVNVRVSFMDKDVLIPTYAFWDDGKDARKHPENLIISQINHRMDSEIDFNFAFAEEDPETGELNYYGTRLLAMKNKRVDTWYAKLTDGSWYMNEGDITEARVTEVWPKHAVLEISGVESVIHRDDVSRKQVDDLTDTKNPRHLEPGQVVRVKIMKIKRQEMPKDLIGFSYPVSLSVSMKALEEDANEKYFHTFKEGQTRRAFITNIATDIKNPDDKTAYYCELEGKPAVVRCYLADGLLKAGVDPREGDKARIRITKKEIVESGKHKGEHRIYGEIFRVIKEGSPDDVVFIVNR